MAKKACFKEKQKVNQWWIWLVVLAIDFLFIYAFVQQVFMGIDFGYHPLTDTSLILLTIFILLLNLVLLSSCLKTRITNKTIYFRFFPFHWSYRFYYRERIKKAEVIKFNPIMDFGGWGLRGWRNKHKKAYNISGKYGLSLELDNGKTIIIGTKKPDEISEIINGINSKASLGKKTLKQSSKNYTSAFTSAATERESGLNN